MNIDETANEKLRALSVRMGTELEIRKLWPDEYGPGFFFRFYGLMKDEPLLKVEVVGSYWFGIRNGEESEEVDIFPFINGKRVSPCRTEHYLHGSESVSWDQLDMAYDDKYSMAQLLLDEET